MIGLSVKFGEKSSSAGYLENLHLLRQRFLEARSSAIPESPNLTEKPMIGRRR